MTRSTTAAFTALGAAVAFACLIATPATAAPVLSPSPVATLASISANAPIRAMVRNGTTTKQTQIIGSFANTSATGGYVTRQSNTGTGPNAGGGAIYGCRGAPGGTAAGSAPCIRANNLATGFAFEFAFNGASGGEFIAGGAPNPNANAAPFTTNATAVATGLNADRVDSQSAAQIAATPGPPNGAAGGELTGTYPNPQIASTTRGVAAASVTVTATGALQSFFNRASGTPAVVHTAGTGEYTITFPGASFDTGSNAAPVATLLGAFGFVNARTSGGSVVVMTANTAGATTDEAFSLVVFGASPTG